MIKKSVSFMVEMFTAETNKYGMDITVGQRTISWPYSCNYKTNMVQAFDFVYQ